MAERIRTLHVNTDRTFRGGEQQVMLLMRGLVERGHEAALVARPGAELARRAAGAGFPVRPIRVRGDLDPLAFVLLCAALRDADCDVVHTHTGHAQVLGVWASRLTGVGRRVVSRRVVSDIGATVLSRLKYRCGVDRYVAISEAVKAKLVDSGVGPGRIAVVNSAVEAERFEQAPDRSAELRRELGIPEGAPVVGTVGALCPAKGFAHFVDAVPLVRRERPEARFVLVGDGELRAPLERHAARLGLGRDVLIFAGWRGDVPELLRLFDVFVSSSVREGLGTAVLQALAAGRGVVVTDAGGLPEIVRDGESGLVVPAGRPDALARGIVRALNAPDLRARMAKAGCRAVKERFTPDRMVEGTLAVYREVLGRT